MRIFELPPLVPVPVDDSYLSLTGAFLRQNGLWVDSPVCCWCCRFCRFVWSPARGGACPIFVDCCDASRERFLILTTAIFNLLDGKLVDKMTTSMADPLDFGEQQRFDQLHHQQLEQKLFNTGPRASRTLPTATVIFQSFTMNNFRPH